MESPIYWYRNPIERPRTEIFDPRIHLVLGIWLILFLLQLFTYWHELNLYMKGLSGIGILFVAAGLVNQQTEFRCIAQSKLINLEIWFEVLRYQNESVSYEIDFSKVVKMTYFPFFPDGGHGKLRVDEVDRQVSYPIYLSGDARWVLYRSLGGRYEERKSFMTFWAIAFLVLPQLIGNLGLRQPFILYGAGAYLLIQILKGQVGPAASLQVLDDELTKSQRMTAILLGSGSFFIGWFMSLTGAI